MDLVAPSQLAGKRDLDPIDLVWVAAVIDCEGAVQLDMKDSRYLSLTIQVNTDDEPIPQHLYQLCGGRLLQFQASYGKGTRKKVTRIQHRWRIYGRNAQELLRKISPYLLSKRRHAEIVDDVMQQLSGRQDLDPDRLRELLVEYKSLTHKGYEARDWDARVRKLVEFVQQRQSAHSSTRHGMP